MNEKNPEMPREELEAQLTALILGELPAEQAFALGRAIEQDADLAKLYERLKQTIQLVRETEASPTEQTAARPAPLKLSDRRRQKLFQQFKTVAPKEFVEPRRRGMRLVEVAAVLAILLLIAAIAIPNFTKARSTSQSAAVITNLRQLEGAKEAWAFENHKSANDQPTLNDLRPYVKLQGGAMPSIAGETYVLGRVSDPVTADVRAPEAKKWYHWGQATTSSRGKRISLYPDGKVAFADNKEIDALRVPPAPVMENPPVPDGIAAVADPNINTIVLPPVAELAYAQDATVTTDPTRRGGFALLGPQPSSNASVLNGDETKFAFRSRLSKRNGGEDSFFADNPEWVGVLEKPAQDNSGGKGGGGNPKGIFPSSGLDRINSNRFLSRYAYTVAPEGNPLNYSLDLNRNGAVDPTTGLPASPAGPGGGGGSGGTIAAVTSPEVVFQSGVPNHSLGEFSTGTRKAEEIAQKTVSASGTVESGGVSATNAIIPLQQSQILNFGAGKVAMERANAFEGDKVDGLSAGELKLRSLELAAESANVNKQLDEDGLHRNEPGTNVHSLGIVGYLNVPPQTNFGALTLNGLTSYDRNTFYRLESQLGADSNEAQTKVPIQYAKRSPIVLPSLQQEISTPHEERGKEVALAPTPQRPAISTAAETAKTDTAISEGIPRGRAGKPADAEASRGYFDAKRNLEELQRFRQVLAMKIEAEKINRTQLSSGGIAALEERWKQQEASVREAQAKVDQLRKELKIPDVMVGGDAALTLMSGETLRRIEGMRIESKAELVRQEALLKKLKELSPEELIPAGTIDFRGVDLDQVLKVYAELADRKVLRPDTLPKPAIILKTQTPLTRSEAVQALDAVMALNGIAMINVGEKAVKAVQTLAASQEGADPANLSGERLAEMGKYVTRLVQLQHARPSELVQALRPFAKLTNSIMPIDSSRILVLRDSPENISRMLETIAKTDVAGDKVDLALENKTPASAPAPQPEVQTHDNIFSTFSLNVSDVSFKLAAASLEKGTMPEPATVRSEEFINAFDYRDPEPPSGVPVAFAWERANYPFAQSRDLLRFSIKTAAAGRQPGRPLNIVLLLDNSGSMERADRVRISHEALRVLASQLQPQDKFSVVTFSRTARLWVDGVPGGQATKAAEDLGKLTPEGGTNLEEAMNLAYQTASRHYLVNGINRVVLLTDGAANLGNVEPEALKQKVEAQRKQGIALDCFGIGWEGFNDDLLEVLSRNGDGRYGFINTPEEAATEFAGQLAGALHVAASDVKVQVEFNPARVTAYRQIGYAKHQLTKEQFRDNTVDAAEIGAAESGNALYTIEVNPRGDGPLATVRVRYKVPGTAEYHEHEWAVPYTGNAISLEQASAAMRLAATASAFSEWLVSSPYAGEVTPDRLLGYLSGVPEVYGADARPKKLEWMIRQAKSIAGK